MNKLVQIMGSTILAALLLTACIPSLAASPALGVPTGDPRGMPLSSMGEAQVLSVEVLQQPGSRPPVTAIVGGILTQSCASLGGWDVNAVSNIFVVTLYVVTPNESGCVQTKSPFETVVPLNTADLPPGMYTVTANGVSTYFTIPAANEATRAAPTAVPSAAPTQAACSDAATFVSDVTIPDQSVLAPGVAFTKTWKLKNSGTCTWDSSYLVSWISGTTMTQQPGYWIVQGGQTVAPGQNVDVSVGMTAPVQNGSYASYWGLRQENGSLMPIAGGAHGDSFYVKIKVDDGSNPPSGHVTNASIDVGLEQGSGAICTADSTYFVHAYITADGPTTANYEIGSTAGQIPAGYFETSGTSGPSPYVTGAVTFNEADTKTISLRFVGPYPYPDDITMTFRVNGGTWHNAKVMCP
jgi:hypothetical protein